MHVEILASAGSSARVQVGTAYDSTGGVFIRLYTGTVRGEGEETLLVDLDNDARRALAAVLLSYEPASS